MIYLGFLAFQPALHVVLPLHMLVQTGGHQVFKAQAIVSNHQSGVVKVELGRLQNGACNVVVERAYHRASFTTKRNNFI